MLALVAYYFFILFLVSKARFVYYYTLLIECGPVEIWSRCGGLPAQKVMNIMKIWGGRTREEASTNGGSNSKGPQYSREERTTLPLSGPELPDRGVIKRVQDVGTKAGRGVAPTDQLWVYV